MDNSVRITLKAYPVAMYITSCICIDVIDDDLWGCFDVCTVRIW